MKRAHAGLLLAVLVLAVTAVGCPCLGVIVNPSAELRWWLFSNFGAQRICPEMLQVSVPLRLQERATAMGRFFPQRCSATVDDTSRTVTVRFGGTGYGFTPVSGRIGFAVDAAVQYRMDFRISNEGAYVWGIFNRATAGPTFRLLFVENKLAAVAAPFGGFTNAIGQQVVRGGLTRGFTVLHTNSRWGSCARPTNRMLPCGWRRASTTPSPTSRSPCTRASAISWAPFESTSEGSAWHCK